MSNIAKGALAYILTQILVRLGYWFFNFHPTKDFPFWPGLVIDFLIWLFFFSLFYSTIGRFSKKESPKP